MAENRVTAEALEAGIVRTSVPGDARLTAQAVEVALLKDVVPGGSARVTAAIIEVGVLRTASGARSGDFFFAI